MAPSEIVDLPRSPAPPASERGPDRHVPGPDRPDVVDLREPTDRRWRRRFRGAIALVVLLGAVLRLATLPAGAPYQAYVDEGHVLARSDHVVAASTWDPDWYRYPSLVPVSIGAVTLAMSTFDADLRRDAEVAEASPYYDLVSPGTLLAGRLLVWATSVATIGVAALLARRVAGRTVALVAAVLVAVLPAFVTRSAIVIVDTPATFLAVATALATATIAGSRRPWLLAAIAGACAGTAATSKYTVGAALLMPLIAAALLPGARIRRRVALAATSTGAAGLAAIATMPALVVRTDRVRDDLADQATIYANKVGRETYASELGSAGEVGWVLVALGLAGLVVLLGRPHARTAAIGWLVFAGATVSVALSSSYQPFRNLLPIVPLLMIGAATAVVAGARWLAARVASPAVTTRRLAAVATVAIGVLVLATGTVPWVAGVPRVDSRTEAVDWLAQHTRSGQRILVAEELVVAPWELARVPATVDVRPVVGPTGVADVGGYDYVVTSRWKEPEAGGLDPDALVTVVTFGKRSVPATTTSRRTNEAVVRIARPGASATVAS